MTDVQTATETARPEYARVTWPLPPDISIPQFQEAIGEVVRLLDIGSYIGFTHGASYTLRSESHRREDDLWFARRTSIGINRLHYGSDLVVTVVIYGPLVIVGIRALGAFMEKLSLTAKNLAEAYKTLEEGRTERFARHEQDPRYDDELIDTVESALTDLPDEAADKIRRLFRDGRFYDEQGNPVLIDTESKLSGTIASREAGATIIRLAAAGVRVEVRADREFDEER